MCSHTRSGPVIRILLISAPVSPLFMAQLPRITADLPLDNLTSPFAVLLSAYDASPDVLHPLVRQSLVRGLLDQVCNTSQPIDQD